MLPFAGIFRQESALYDWTELPSGNWACWGSGFFLDPNSREDVKFTPASLWNEGKGLFSKLAWGDHVRNTRIAYELEKKEPGNILDVGCGAANYMATAIAGLGIDTNYVALDANGSHAHGDWLRDVIGRRPMVGIAMDANDDWPFVGGVFDVILCLEALEHFATDRALLKRFFEQVMKHLKWHGILYLATPVPEGPDAQGRIIQHPHCHSYEHFPWEIVNTCEEVGLKVWQCWNYRARPQAVKALRMDAKPPIKGEGFPPAMVDAFALPRLTYDHVIPGNALYMIGRNKV